MRALIQKLINRKDSRKNINVVFEINESKKVRLTNPKSSTNLMPNLIVHHSDHGAPSVDIEINKKNIELNINEPGSGENGTWWGLRIIPKAKQESIGSEIFVLKFDITMSKSDIAPSFLAKAVDSKHDTLEYVNNKSAVELIHIVHPESKEIFFDLNIGEWASTADLKKGKVVIKNLIVEKTNFIQNISEKLDSCRDVSDLFQVQSKKLKLYLFELFLSKFFNQKNTAFWKNNPEGLLLPLLITRKDVVFDIGGNWGIYTLELSKLAKQVMYFEPNPDVFPFAQNLLRECDNVTLLQLGLGRKVEEKSFFISKNLRDPLLESGGGTFGNKATEEHSKDYVSRNLYIVPGDSFKELAPSFIKIDVEGQELSVLQGLNETLVKFAPKLFVEIDNAWNKKAHQVFKYLDNLNYICLYYSKKTNKFIQISDEIRMDNFDFEIDSNGNYVFISKADKTLIKEIENSYLSYL